jgi:hypothetical protein
MTLNKIALLRALIVATLACSILSIVVDQVMQKYLPLPLLDYLDAEMQRQTTAMEWSALGFVLALLVASLVSLAGLWRFKAWGRLLYTWTLPLGVLITPLLGPVVSDGIAYALAELASTGAGMILALIWFSDLAAHFSPPKEPAAAA